jgi:hypothetical protein
MEDDFQPTKEQLDALAMEKDTPKNQKETESPKPPKGENPEEKSKELQSALAQKEHFRQKFEEAQKKLEQLEKKSPQETPKETDFQDPLKTVRLAKALQDFSEEEAEFVLRHAKSSDPEDIIKATQDEWVRDAIQARREKVKKQQAVPEPSSPLAHKETSENIEKEFEKGSFEWIKKKEAELEAKERGSGI